jgi:RNA polymerase sigma factor (TIGR02999 family)
VSSKDDVTRLLADLRAGKEDAAENLLPLLYDELHALARYYMQDEKRGHTLQTTALVHEAYLRLCGSADQSWENRAHYLRVAARAMRHVLIDHARRKLAEKRGGRRNRESLDMVDRLLGESRVDLVGLDHALNSLSELDPRMEQIVELRFFSGLTIEETAKVLGVSPRTVKYDWTLAKAWLKEELE